MTGLIVGLIAAVVFVGICVTGYVFCTKLNDGPGL